jgi:hypothetical protein
LRDVHKHENPYALTALITRGALLFGKYHVSTVKGEFFVTRYNDPALPATQVPKKEMQTVFFCALSKWEYLCPGKSSLGAVYSSLQQNLWESLRLNGFIMAHNADEPALSTEKVDSEGIAKRNTLTDTLQLVKSYLAEVQKFTENVLDPQQRTQVLAMLQLHTSALANDVKSLQYLIYQARPERPKRSRLIGTTKNCTKNEIEVQRPSYSDHFPPVGSLISPEDQPIEQFLLPRMISNAQQTSITSPLDDDESSSSQLPLENQRIATVLDHHMPPYLAKQSTEESNEIKWFINLKDGLGCTALHYACYAGAIDAVKFLLEFGASTEYKGPIFLRPRLKVSP